MALRRETKIQRYMDACRDVAALSRQLAEHPDLKAKRGWMEHYNDARVRKAEFLRLLSGGEQGEAHRRLRAQEAAGK